MGRWFLWVPSTSSSRPPSGVHKNGEIPLARCCFFCPTLSQNSTLFTTIGQVPGRPPSSSDFQELSLFTVLVILAAWNFPLTSMKLYDCCPLQCIQGGCAESFSQKRWLPPTFVQSSPISIKCVTKNIIKIFCLSQQTKTQHNKHKHVSTKLVQVMPHQGKIPTRRCPAAFQPSVPEKCRFVNEKGRTRTQTTNEFGSPGVNSSTALTRVNTLTHTWHGSAMF